MKPDNRLQKKSKRKNYKCVQKPHSKQYINKMKSFKRLFHFEVCGSERWGRENMRVYGL